VTQYSRDSSDQIEKPRRTGSPACAGDDTVGWGEIVPYALNVSRNRTGSPVDGVITSPCHITRLPRTKVPTGQPVTRTPS
jgi:hypothetical protein